MLTVPRHSAFPSITLSQCCAVTFSHDAHIQLNILPLVRWEGRRYVCWVSRVEAMRTARSRHYWSRWRWRCWKWGLHVVQWKQDLEISLSMYVQLGWNGSWIAEVYSNIDYCCSVMWSRNCATTYGHISALTRVPCGFCVSVCQICASVFLWLSPFSCATLQMEHRTPPHPQTASVCRIAADTASHQLTQTALSVQI